MKLKLIIWATPPSNKTLNDKFKKALNTKFITKKKNFEFYNELKLFILGLKIFLISSYYEIIVNLKNGLIFKIIVFNKKLRIEESIKSHPNIFQIMLSVLKTKPVIKRKNNQLNSVLKEGEPLIIVSNHPYVPIDGFSIMSFIHKHRKDYSLVINSYKLLESLKHKYLNHFIPVVNTPTKLLKRNDSFAHKLNVRSLKKCINALNVGRCIVIFPAGEASKAKKWGDEITDPQWLNGVGMIIKHKVNRGEPLNILPIYVSESFGLSIALLIKFSK